MTVHIVGAGLAGLSAAVHLADAGRRVTLYEAAPQAGGRARTYHDATLGLTIDNGNHLVLAGNRAVMDYVRRIGAADRLRGPAEARYPWVDLATGERWTLRPNAGRLPWWIMVPSRRVPGTGWRDYLALDALRRAKPGRTIGQTIPTTGALWHRLLEPFLVSALNTPPREASAQLAGAIIRESLALGGAASAPRIAQPTLSAAFVDPALDHLRRRGAEVRLGTRLRALCTGEGRVTALAFGDGEAPVGARDRVIIATPAWVTAELIAGVQVPTEHHAIVNAHFAWAPPPGTEPITGCVGGMTEWVFAHPDRLSVTISAADQLSNRPRDELAMKLWIEVQRAIGVADVPLPLHRIIVEKRATFAATPEQDVLRPSPHTIFENLLLAGDWTQTELPATIEGAIRSGVAAAGLALQRGNA
ncbi:MAG: hydroxysqualene dehydroxylase HpnE [Sphingomonadaceae bacterium]|nr:hydroxysqualene dehydroxylase HpnE [Sphingomonadaceae bacterium]